MLLSCACGDGRTWTVCPPLWLGAAPAALGVLLLPPLLWRSPVNERAAWPFVVLAALFLVCFGYAFARAALSLQVRVLCDGPSLVVRAYRRTVALEAAEARIEVRTRVHGVGRRVTLSEVILSAPGGSETFTLHMGFTAWGARHAARRIAHALRVRTGSAPLVS
jgi:hypothetical protein